jgi:hypothetical protein
VTYDDMPVDTVLRCTDGEFLGLIVVRDEHGWTSAGSEERCVPSDFGDDWIELVEKPAAPANLRDSSGDWWAWVDGGYASARRARYGRLLAGVVLLSRAEVDDHYGPLTEVAP